MGKEKKDTRLLNTLFGEGSGGTQPEIDALTQLYLNKKRTIGLEPTLNSSAAYTTRSPQYTNAATGKADLSMFQDAMSRFEGQPITPYTHHENVNAFGTPYWAQGVTQYEDIGRQRFYQINPEQQQLNISTIQTKLKEKGFDPGPIDGIIGDKTRAAIKAFQKANGLDVDGILGQNTGRALFGGSNGQ